jgi:hypothetical protein
MRAQKTGNSELWNGLVAATSARTYYQRYYQRRPRHQAKFKQSIAIAAGVAA